MHVQSFSETRKLSKKEILNEKLRSTSHFVYLVDGDGRRVVAAHLEGAHTAGKGADISGVCQKADRLKAGGVVGSDRADQHKQLGRLELEGLNSTEVAPKFHQIL